MLGADFTVPIRYRIVAVFERFPALWRPILCRSTEKPINRIITGSGPLSNADVPCGRQTTNQIGATEQMLHQ
jgi:hypothetical protein